MLHSLRQIIMETILAPNIFEDKKLRIIFFLMLMKEYVFVSRNFLLLHKLKKGRQLNLCQLFTRWTLVEPSQMIPAILLTNYNRGRKLLSLETCFIYLFQNCFGLKLSSTFFPFAFWVESADVEAIFWANCLFARLYRV